MSDARTLKINNVDFTSYCPPAGYEASTVHVYGGNAMTMMTGGKYKDEIAALSKINVAFMPLTDAQMSTLVNTLLAHQTCSVYFFDPDLNDYRTIAANRTLGTKKYRGKAADGNYYWTGFTVSFEEIP